MTASPTVRDRAAGAQEPPKVSVCMITYNHAAYVAQALDSILMQRVEFPIEIVIGEDCSSDGTRVIVETYQAKYPHVVRLLPSERNLGVKANFLRTLLECRGTFVALLEGDDYWTDPEKLARQVEFLDASPQYAGCATRVQEVGGPGEQRIYPEAPGGDVALDSFLRANPFHTCSVVYRRAFPPFPEWFGRGVLGDWPLHLLHALHGPFRVMSEVTACYRLHGGGVWSGAETATKLRRTIEMLVAVRPHVPREFESVINQTISRQWSDVIYVLALAGDRTGIRQEVRNFRNDPSFPRWSPKTLLFAAAIGVGYVWPAALRAIVAVKRRLWPAR